MSLAGFLATRPYQADLFQIEAGEALAAGDTVVVTAPTGSGKTLVADIAVHLAYEAGRRAFYTTPIKALSNQKYGDLVVEYGRDEVGLLTGDNVINAGAPIVVMTTEVLRNMIYADESVLDDVEFVVLDEVHYLEDRFRGAVWEEIIIHAPRHVRLVCLSATIANADEFAGWIRSRRGQTTLVVARERPVPLDVMYLLADRVGPERLRLLPTFASREGKGRPNPRIEHLLGLEHGRRNRFTTPGRIEVIEMLSEQEMLPAIYFIFSRAGCDAAALALLEAGVRLGQHGDDIDRIAEKRTSHLSDRDLAALDYGRWLSQLKVGVAAHHAGLVPAFKETVEELFATGRLGVVFATETLALGINMPARSVVLENLSKFDGEGHSVLEPGDFTQLTGRAGRRGIDRVGYGVVLHSRFVRFEQVTRIASIGSHPLRSSFRPTFNMATNLVANYDRGRAEELLSASFAQYQRSGSQEAAERSLEVLEQRWAEELDRATCDRGSVAEYLTLVDGVEGQRSAELAGRLQPGDVVDVPSGPRAGRFVVVRRVARGKTGMRLLVMGTTGRFSSIAGREVVSGSTLAGTLELPRPFQGNDRSFQQHLLRRLRSVPAVASVPPGRSEPMVDHPVAGCPDASHHLTGLRRARRTERKIEQFRADLRRQGVGLVEDFRAIEVLLNEWGYLDGWNLTSRGNRLRFVYNLLDLLLVESVERGLFWGLDASELASLASCFVYEPRTDQPSSPDWPTVELEQRFEWLDRLSTELTTAERSHRLPATRSPDPGFVTTAHAWASGVELDDLPEAGFAPGDVVRVFRQLVDLLKQLRDVFPELADVTRSALDSIDRGVVAAQGAR